MCDPSRLTAPAPNSRAGMGSHSPLRTKPPTVVIVLAGRVAVGFPGSTPAMPFQYEAPPSWRPGLVVVNPSSAEN